MQTPTRSAKENNLVDNNRDLKTEQTLPPNLYPGGSALEYLESTLPYDLVITKVKATRLLPAPQNGTPPFPSGNDINFILNQSFWVLNAPQQKAAGKYEPYHDNVNDEETYDPSKVSKPGTTETSFQGSGGNYLSNEIFYRVALLRNTKRPPLKTGGAALATGHFHLPYTGSYGNNPQITGPGLIYSVQTAAQRFLRYLFRLHKPTDLTFPGTNVNTTSAAQLLKATNTTQETLNVSAVEVSPPFAVTLPSATPIAVGPRATLNLPFTFRPTTPGVQSQNVKLRDASGELLLIITLRAKVCQRSASQGK